MRLLDSRQSAARNLTFFAYDCRTEDRDSSFSLLNLHTHRMDALKEYGFSISPERKIVHAGNSHEAEMFYKDIELRRDSLPFEIDGLVGKAVMDEVRDQLGFADRVPKWAIAWKFEAEEAQTILENIEYEVGRTGALTPVALLTPVDLAGVTVSRASLHNFDYIKDNDFYIGDTVVIKRAGDVIPFVVRPVLEKRPQTATQIIEPTHCPICHHETTRDKIQGDETARVLRCSNLACVGRLKSRLKYFVSKSGLDIEGFGNKIVEILFDKGFLGTPEKDYCDIFSSVFTLESHKSELLQIEGLGEKSVTQLLTQISEKNKPSFSKFVQAFGIKGVGSVSSIKLATYFASLDDMIDSYLPDGKEYQKFLKIQALRDSIQKLSENKITADMVAEDNSLKELKKSNDEQLSSLRAEEPKLVQELALGSSATEELIEFFKHPRYHEELKNLLATNFEITYEKQDKISLGQTIFTDKKIMMSGKSQYFSTRQDVQRFITSLGATVAPGVTKNLDYLILGEKPGSEKVKKAIDLGIPMLNEKEFLEKLDLNIVELYIAMTR